MAAGTLTTMGENEELLTERLSLRRPTSADVDAILAIHHNPRTYEYNPSDALATRADAGELFHRWDEHWRQCGYGYWVLRRRDPAGPGTGRAAAGDRDSPPIGFCGVKRMQLRDRPVLNLFYRLDPAAWGAGLATEAAATVVAWARRHIPEYPVIARVHPDNVASQRVALNSGLVRAPELDGPGYDGVDDWLFTSGAVR